MARSAPITPTAARTGESHSRPQTWTGKFPAIFWMMALSWSATLSNCGRFFWWHSEPCSLCPVGLGRNWYFFAPTTKKTCEMPSSTTLPSPSTLPIPYPPRRRCRQCTYHKDNKQGAEQSQCWKPDCLRLQPRHRPCRQLHPVWDRPRRANRSSRRRFCWWRRRGAGWQIVITDLPSISAGEKTTQAQGGLSSGRGTSRRRRDQQRASMFGRSKAASRQHQLLTTCVKLKELCKNGKLQTTPHNTIMEQLQNRADRFRKQG
jgi:hypothetical protein